MYQDQAAGITGSWQGLQILKGLVQPPATSWEILIHFNADRAPQRLASLAASTCDSRTLSLTAWTYSAHVQDRPEVCGQGERRVWNWCLWEQPSTIADGVWWINTPACLPLGWENPELCSIPSPRDPQWDLDTVAHSNNILINIICLGFLPFPVSFSQSCSRIT